MSQYIVEKWDTDCFRLLHLHDSGAECVDKLEVGGMTTEQARIIFSERYELNVL